MLTITDPVEVANGLRPALLHLSRRLRKELAPLGITGGQASLLWAFPLLTFGIITGAIVSASLYGTFWAWQPRENLAILAWAMG